MMWGGRFSKDPKKEVLEFNSGENILLDDELVLYDIFGNLAHVKMLSEVGIISKKEAEEIKIALLKIKKDFETGKFLLKKELEDVHMNVESAVSSATSAGKKMHTARSRNDQVVLDTRLFLRDKVLEIGNGLLELQNAFIELSKKDGFFVAYTHTRVAQPQTVSYWCDNYVQSFSRDLDRLTDFYKRINQNPLGACACTGTSWPINRKRTAELLGFESVQENALDVVSSRWEFEAELLSIISIIMTKLSRISEELIWYSEKGLIEIGDEFCTGSSIMPNKKNADALEIVRGRTGRIYGELLAVLTSAKGLISGYNSDSQETKKPLFDSIKISEQCLRIVSEVIKSLEFNFKNIEEELENGYAQATELADVLAMKGIPFREAHEISGKIVKEFISKGKKLSELKLIDLQKFTKIKVTEFELKRIVSLERERLKVRIDSSKITEYSKWVEEERKRINGVYFKLF